MKRKAKEEKMWNDTVKKAKRHRANCDYKEPSIIGTIWAGAELISLKQDRDALRQALRNVVQWTDACWTVGHGGNQSHPAWEDVQKGRTLLIELEES